MEKKHTFDFEKLDVYQKSFELVQRFFRLTRDLPREYQFSLGEQLRRAGLSIVNNLAEGSGKISKKEKAQYYKTSLNSARECVPMLTLLLKEELISPNTHEELRQEIVHVCNMLGRLILSIQNAQHHTLPV